MTRARARVLPALLLLVSGACGPKHLALPSGEGAPFAGFAAAFEQASARCAAVRTLTAELAVSGRAAGARLRVRVLAGFARPASLRLEAVAPFGAPLFILVTRGDDVTLLLQHDNQVLSDTRPSEVLGALTGIDITPADLGAVLAGCVAAGAKPTDGTSSGGWLKVGLGEGRTAYLRNDPSGWRIEAGIIGNLVVEYVGFGSAVPQTIRLWTRRPRAGEAAPTDLLVRLSQVEVDASLDPAAFRVVVPSGATPLTLDELRRSGPPGAAGATKR